MDTKELALSGARKLCGIGACYYDLDCGHANNQPKWPKLRPDAACPLAKYNIEPEKETQPWWKRHANEIYVSRDEIYALCAECENGEILTDEEGEYVQRKDLFLCSDCPVKGAEEAMDENAAER